MSVSPESPLTLGHCPNCGVEREFEQPPCTDGHGSDCPERACIECGGAVVIDFDLEVEEVQEVNRAA